MPSDGNPSFHHLWAVMDIHPKSLVMDIHAPSRLFIQVVELISNMDLTWLL